MSHALIDKYTEKEIREIVSKSFSMSELIKNLGYKCISGNQNHTVKKRLLKYNIDISHFTYATPTTRTEDNVFCIASSASQSTLRRWYKKLSSNEVCSICGQGDVWNNQQLVLSLDHINGDNRDNRLENLRWVCPNCDRQLPTYAGKNLKQTTKIKINQYCVDCGKIITSTANRCPICAQLYRRVAERPVKDELKKLIQTRTFAEIGRMYNVTDNTIRKWCITVNLPSRKIDIEKYTQKEWDLL